MAMTKGFMAALEQATKRGHELDSTGYSDTKVYGGLGLKTMAFTGVPTPSRHTTAATAATGPTITASSVEKFTDILSTFDLKSLNTVIDNGDKEVKTILDEIMKKEDWTHGVSYADRPKEKKVVSDPIELSGAIEATLTDEAERSFGGAARGTW